MSEWFSNLSDLEGMTAGAVYVVLFTIVFVESGLLVGFFLPGDSLLFTAGFLSWKGDLPSLPIVAVGCFVAAVAGDQVGYGFGRRVGPALFRRPDSRLFHQSHVERAQRYFAQHGAKTIVLARFVPVVRTFAPIVAGVGHMPYRTFVIFNVAGGLLWGVGLTTLGHVAGSTLGEAIDVDRYLLPTIAVIVVASFVPVVVELRRSRRERARATEPQHPS